MCWASIHLINRECESYKKNMFALLGKPGYEELAAEIGGKKSDS